MSKAQGKTSLFGVICGMFIFVLDLILLVGFILFKLMGVIDWSWVLVFSPAWGGFLVMLGIISVEGVRSRKEYEGERQKYFVESKKLKKYFLESEQSRSER